MAAQSNLLPQLKFVNLDQIDFRSKYQREMKGQQPAPLPSTPPQSSGLIRLQKVQGSGQDTNPLDFPRNMSNNAAILKHDFFSMKLLEFVRKYNQDLFDFKQQNGLQLQEFQQDQSKQLQARVGGSQRRKSLSMLDQYRNRANKVTIKTRQNPSKIISNTLKLKNMALQQVVCVTIASTLDYILNEKPHCDDIKLQRSMLSDLYRWHVK